MKVIRTFMLSLVLTSSASFADITAEEALRQKLMSLQNFQAEFAQQVTDAEGVVLQESAGRLVLQQPDKMFWEVTEPDENQLIADGDTLWHIDPFVEQVVAMSQESTIANNPFVLLTDPYSQAWQDFQISQFADTFVVQSQTPDSQIAKLVLSFSGDELTGLSFVDRQEQVSELTFKNIQMNASIEAALFTFDVPEGFTLDDQRQP